MGWYYQLNSVARIICVAVATLANEKLLKCASDNDLLLCRKSTSNKMRYRQWFDRCIISKMILKSGSNWLFPVVISVEITLSGSHSGNSFEFTGFLNYALFCLEIKQLLEIVWNEWLLISSLQLIEVSLVWVKQI
jgi:hypothetical protein